jgi:ATP-dependent Clp protease ATP-binding subunit ClpC
MSSNYEIQTIFWKEAGFDIQVARLPEEALNDKLALLSTGSGTLTKTIYDHFLAETCLVDASSVINFFKHSHLSDEEATEAVAGLVKVILDINPLLDPEVLVINENNLIKLPDQSDTKSRPLKENSDWNKSESNLTGGFVPPDALTDDMLHNMTYGNPFIGNGMSGYDGDIELKTWDRLGILVGIKVYTPKDVKTLFSSAAPNFQVEEKYKLFIVTKCVNDYSVLFTYIDGLDKIGMQEIIDDLYKLSVEVNPFLDYGKVDFKKIDRIRAKANKTRGKTETEDGLEEILFIEDISKEAILDLGTRIKTSLIGQDDAVHAIVETTQIAHCGLKPTEPPIGTFLLCGRTGVGKTHCAKILSKELCGKDRLIRIDCSEYGHSHDVMKLLGAPPSYVGHDDGGFLTKAIKENPFSVVLFDEVEKAHSKLHDMLLQIMEDGRLTSGKGEVVSFDSAVILLTSNIGVKDIDNISKTAGFGDVAVITEDRKGKAIKKALRRSFKPEFLNRLDGILVFKSLGKESCLSIIKLAIKELNYWLLEKNIIVELTEEVVDYILKKGFSKEYGARPLKRFIRKNLVKPLAIKILHEEIVEGDYVNIKLADDKLLIEPRILPDFDEEAL